MERKETAASFPWEVFEGGARPECELRLTREEREWFLRECPGATCTPMGDLQDGKAWYHIILEGTWKP